MPKARAINKRRKAVQNIKKITRTMELIATARFSRARDRAIQAEAYTRKISELVRDLGTSAADVRHPLLEVRDEPRNAVLLVLTSNRGLCGGYNAGVLRVANRQYQELHSSGLGTRLEVVGERGINFFRFRGVKADQTFTHFEDKPRFDEVEELANRYIQMYVRGTIDRLDVAYTRFISTARQEATVLTLLPLAAPKAEAPESISPTRQAAHAASTNGQPAAPVQYEFLPGPANILEEILPISFKIRLFKCFLDAAVSEQIARMVAMKGATENANNMIRSLTMLGNRARQAEITRQIAEIIGGAAALE